MTDIEIKNLESSEVEVESWVPDVHEDVFFRIHLDTGEVGSEASNSFHAMVATPEGLRKHGAGEILSERATLVFSEYSPELLRETLMRIIKECRGYSWAESVRNLNRYFHWEYEDFR